MTCDYCHTEVMPRRDGGRKQRFCPGGECRKEFFREARRVGAKALRRRRARSRTIRLTDLEVMEREAEAAGCPGMFIRPSAARRARSLRTALGLAAIKMGVINA